MTDAPASVRRRDVRTPVTILTGFLGSGKTTLLNRAMADPAMARALVVINEFGEIGLDHALVAASDDTIVVLENGCLCCTVFGDLVATLNRAYHQREAGEIPHFDHVVIETSGLADPGPVLQAFLSEPTLEGLYRIGGVIATLDAINGAGTLAKHVESARQIALADQVLVTKADLLAENEQLATIEASARQLNAAAQVLIAGAGIDAAALLLAVGPDPAAGGPATRAWLAHAVDACGHDHAHDHQHAASVVAYDFVRDTPIPREALQLLLGALERNLGPGLLRVKGLVNVAEEPGRPAVVQGAQHLLHNLAWLDRWPSEDERTRLVFIVDGLPREEIEAMVALLDRVAMRTAKARQSVAANLDSKAIIDTDAPSPLNRDNMEAHSRWHRQ